MMIKRSSELADGTVSILSGRGEVHQTVFLDHNTSCQIVRLGAIVTIAPGKTTGFHIHHNDYEVCYVLSGTARATDDNEQVVLHPGDVQYCYAGHGHELKNIGDSDLVLVALIVNL